MHFHDTLRARAFFTHVNMSPEKSNESILASDGSYSPTQGWKSFIKSRFKTMLQREDLLLLKESSSKTISEIRHSTPIPNASALKSPHKEWLAQPIAPNRRTMTHKVTKLPKYGISKVITLSGMTNLPEIPHATPGLKEIGNEQG